MNSGGIADGAVGAEAIVHAIGQILSARTSLECISAFRATAADFGVDTFASGEVDTLRLHRSVFHVIEWPEDWRRYYFGSGLLDRDPVVGALGKRDGSFTWAELRADRTLPRIGTESLDRLAEAGWTDGLVVPLPRGGNRFGLVSLVARAKQFTPTDKMLLSPLCICFHEKMRGMVAADALPATAAGLTRRELACLELVVRGMSDREIALELGIAPSTVHDHIESARKRFGASTRSELAAAAVSLGLVHG